MKDNVTLKELLVAVVRQGKRILVLATVLALLLGGVQTIKEVKEYWAERNALADREVQYQTAIEEYNARKEELKGDLEGARQRLNAQQEYLSESLIMKLDPYDIYATVIHFAITDFQEEDIQSFIGWGMTSVDYIVEKIQNQYASYWTSVNLATKLGYEEKQEKYIREIVTMSGMTGGGLTIQVLAGDEASSKQLAELAVDCLKEGIETVSVGAYSHTLTVLAQSTKNEVSDSVTKKQQSAVKDLEERIQQTEAIEEELKTLSEPKRENVTAVTDMVKDVCKWAVLGVVAGAVLGSTWIMVAYIFRNRLETSWELEKVTKLPFLGSTVEKRDIFGRCADTLLRERVWKEEEEAKEFVRQNLKIALDGVETVALVTTLPQGEYGGILMILLEEEGRKAVCIDMAARNPQAVALIAGCQKAVLAEKTGVSHWEDVADVMALVEKCDTELCGFVMV